MLYPKGNKIVTTWGSRISITSLIYRSPATIKGGKEGPGRRVLRGDQVRVEHPPGSHIDQRWELRRVSKPNLAGLQLRKTTGEKKRKVLGFQGKEKLPSS